MFRILALVLSALIAGIGCWQQAVASEPGAGRESAAQETLGEVLRLAQDESPQRRQRRGQGQPGAGQGTGQGAGTGKGRGQGSERSAPPEGTGAAGGQTLLEQAHRAFRQDRFPEAERLYRAALDQRRQSGASEEAVVPIMQRLGVTIAEQGRHAEAEQLLRRALVAAEAKFGPEHLQVAAVLNSLGYVMRGQARNAEAEPLLRRSLAIRERELGPEHADVATTLSNLAASLRLQRRFKEAEPLARRALAIREKNQGPDHPSVARAITNLAHIMRADGRVGDADALLERAIGIQEKRLGADDPRLANSLFALGQLRSSERKYEEAESLFRRAAAIREKSLGGQHPDLAQALGAQAAQLSRLSRAEPALEAIRRATAIAIARREHDEQRRDEGADSERRSARWMFARHVGIAHLTYRRSNDPQLPNEAFAMAQWAQTGDVGGALARMAARLASGTGPLSALVRERQDALARRRGLDQELIEAVSRNAQERSAESERAAHAEVAALDRRLDELDARLEKEFPRYAELASAKPLTIRRVRELLAPDEALLFFLVRDDDAFVWAMRKDKVLWRRLASTRTQLERSVKVLRESLNPASNPKFAPIPVELAHRLYRELLGPIEPVLDGIKHLLIVPDGPVQSLPFALLAAALPKNQPNSHADHRAVDWLIRKFAITIVPAVSSLHALRALAAPAARASGNRRPFAGFGDPELAGVAMQPVAAASPGRPVRGFLSEAQFLQQLQPLPESAKELRDLARGLKSPPDSVWLRGEATETRVKSTDLSNYRVLAFATHGLMAGEILDFAEPALVLTPPAMGSALDDGLLSASEVAELKLNADWVLLSACNTAAPDGTPGAEGMSGLTKSFFYAGARSLLVSHWPVASEAAVRLTAGAVQALEAAPKIGRAEALRRSMIALLDDAAAAPEMAHPILWAPFVLVGEGGAGR